MMMKTASYYLALPLLVFLLNGCQTLMANKNPEFDPSRPIEVLEPARLEFRNPITPVTGLNLQYRPGKGNNLLVTMLTRFRQGDGYFKLEHRFDGQVKARESGDNIVADFGIFQYRHWINGYMGAHSTFDTGFGVEIDRLGKIRNFDSFPVRNLEHHTSYIVDARSDPKLAKSVFPEFLQNVNTGDVLANLPWLPGFNLPQDRSVDLPCILEGYVTIKEQKGVLCSIDGQIRLASKPGKAQGYMVFDAETAMIMHLRLGLTGPDHDMTRGHFYSQTVRLDGI